MGARRNGRIIAFQSLYRYHMTRAPLNELIEFSWLGEDRLAKQTEDTLTFAVLLIQGVIENQEEVDTVIKSHLEHWDFSRLAKVDLSILRLSVYCLLYQKDIPATVTIDEAIDIAKQFGTADSYRFVNGVLDGIRKQYII